MASRHLARAGLAVALCLAAAGPAAASQTDWMKLRTMNITHQGGEDEAPSGTMYAFARSVRLGADMLEVDIHTSEDGHVVVMHDGTVDRTTEGSGSVYDMTLAELQALDAGHDFVPGIGTTTKEPPSAYVFRGARTGDRPPPKGFRPDAFRIPTLVEVMRAYPQMPINIEIKGAGDEDVQSFLDNAESLAATLQEIGRTEGIIVASFNDAAIARFHELMPEIDLAPSIAETAAFKTASVPPGPGKVAFQVPITFGVQVTDADFVQRAHANGLAVHVWLSNDPENDEIYNQLLDWDVDAVMPAAPAAFERVLCERGVARPPRPAGLPGRHCNHERVSIACDVVPAGLGRMDARGRVRVRLIRRDDFAGGCAGRLWLRAGGRRAAARFDFGRKRPSEGGPGVRTVRVKLPRALRRPGAPRKITAATRAYQAYGAAKRFRLRRR